MIFVECKPDETLVRVLLPRRQVIHARSKPRVVSQVSRRKNCIGLIDEDPGAVQPGYLETLTYTANQYAFRVLEDPNKRNKIVVLRPRLEEWVLQASRLARIRVEDYGLPADPSGLREVINHRLPNLARLVKDLQQSASMIALRKALTP